MRRSLPDKAERPLNHSGTTPACVDSAALRHAWSAAFANLRETIMSAGQNTDLQTAIENAWERRAELSPSTTGTDREAVEAALSLLDSGAACING
jgi:hypothetical protein